MGNVYTDNYQRAFVDVPAGMLVRNPWGNQRRSIFEDYTAAALAAAEVIYICRPPKGFKLRGGYVHSEDLGNNTTLQVGIVGATNKFMAATNHGGGSPVKTELLAAALVAAQNYEFDGDTDLVCVTAVGEATGAIYFNFEFDAP